MRHSAKQRKLLHDQIGSVAVRKDGEIYYKSDLHGLLGAASVH